MSAPIIKSWEIRILTITCSTSTVDCLSATSSRMLCNKAVIISVSPKQTSQVHYVVNQGSSSGKPVKQLNSGIELVREALDGEKHRGLCFALLCCYAGGLAGTFILLYSLSNFFFGEYWSTFRNSEGQISCFVQHDFPKLCM